jgi:hypothetical protein
VCTHLGVALVKEVVVRVSEDELLVAELCALEPRVFEVEGAKLCPPLCIRSELVEVLCQLLDGTRCVLVRKRVKKGRVVRQ